MSCRPDPSTESKCEGCSLNEINLLFYLFRYLYGRDSPSSVSSLLREQLLTHTCLSNVYRSCWGGGGKGFGGGVRSQVSSGRDPCWQKLCGVLTDRKAGGAQTLFCLEVGSCLPILVVPVAPCHSETRPWSRIVHAKFYFPDILMEVRCLSQVCEKYWSSALCDVTNGNWCSSWKKPFLASVFITYLPTAANRELNSLLSGMQKINVSNILMKVRFVCLRSLSHAGHQPFVMSRRGSDPHAEKNPIMAPVSIMCLQTAANRELNSLLSGM